MNEDRFTKLQDLLDRACVKAQDKYEIDFSIRNPMADEAHRKLVDLMFQCADELVPVDDVKVAFQEWIGLLKEVTEALMLVKAKTLRFFSEPRKCYSLGCPGLVRYSAGKGTCPSCGLHQVIVQVKGDLCTLTTYSENPNLSEPSKVVSLEMHRRNRKARGLERQANEASLF